MPFFSLPNFPSKQQTTFTGSKKPNKEMMDAATRGITKAGTSENNGKNREGQGRWWFSPPRTARFKMRRIRDYHRLTMYFPNRTRLIYGEWYGKCLGMGVHTVVFGIFLYRWWLSPPMNEKYAQACPIGSRTVCYEYCSWWSFPNIWGCLEYTNNI